MVLVATWPGLAELGGELQAWCDSYEKRTLTSTQDQDWNIEPIISHDWMIDSGCTNHMFFPRCLVILRVHLLYARLFFPLVFTTRRP